MSDWRMADKGVHKNWGEGWQEILATASVLFQLRADNRRLRLTAEIAEAAILGGPRRTLRLKFSVVIFVLIRGNSCSDLTPRDWFPGRRHANLRADRPDYKLREFAEERDEGKTC